MKKKRVLPPTYLFLSMTIMALLHYLIPVGKIIPSPWGLLGIIPLMVGIALNLIADTSFKRKGTTVKPFEFSSTLITDGVYRRSRHPMYLGMVLILFGVAALMGSLTPFIVVVIFAAIMERVFVRTEEKMLAQKFGEVWEAYKKRVRRWI
jgi:protein-S-isoprenylcysteine O-methyltransferase Ste14